MRRKLGKVYTKNGNRNTNSKIIMGFIIYFP